MSLGSAHLTITLPMTYSCLFWLINLHAIVYAAIYILHLPPVAPHLSLSGINNRTVWTNVYIERLKLDGVPDSYEEKFLHIMY